MSCGRTRPPGRLLRERSNDARRASHPARDRIAIVRRPATWFRESAQPRGNSRQTGYDSHPSSTTTIFDVRRAAGRAARMPFGVVHAPTFRCRRIALSTRSLSQHCAAARNRVRHGRRFRRARVVSRFRDQLGRAFGTRHRQYAGNRAARRREGKRVARLPVDRRRKFSRALRDRHAEAGRRYRHARGSRRRQHAASRPAGAHSRVAAAMG